MVSKSKHSVDSQRNSALNDMISRVGTKYVNRRFKANARERNRMHGLNEALDRLRKCVPIKCITIGSNPGICRLFDFQL